MENEFKIYRVDPTSSGRVYFHLRTAIILVGGEAKRAQGREKYFFLHDGKTFLSRLLDSLIPIVDEVILVARDPDQCTRFKDFTNIFCVTDIRAGTGPIGGIHAGVLAATGENIFISGCDMPFVNREIVGHLFSLINNYDAVIPAWDTEKFEPLHAVYKKEALLKYLESHESLSLRAMIRNLHAFYINVDEFRRIDPNLRSFVNINKLEDLTSINNL
jgi:molybdopterin-guanine dinucleotide biosynthesis protein A